MVLSKALLLKGLGGLVALGGTVTFGVVGHKKGFWSSSKKNDQKTPSDVKEETAESLITNSGLNCTFNSGSNTNEGTCTSLTANKQINVKHENNTKNEGITSISVTGSAKIKVQKETSEGSYNKKVKLTIEGGDITLTGGTPTTITKLEQFETYEIVKEGDKYYLSRKEKATEEVRRNLGLPQSCSFPEDNTTSKTCTIPSTDINSINFLEKSGTVTNDSNSSLTLTITKTSVSEGYPYGLNFSFKSSSGDVTIATTSSDSITIKNTEDSEFKIKKDGNDVKLEKTSTLSTITSKVGITCNSSDNTCTLKTEGKINIKKDQNKSEIDASSTAPTEKIKVYSGTDATGYENGFKFAIEEGDITVGSDSSNKLEEFETYEIKKDETDSKWYLTRKTDALEGKTKALGLPAEDSTCKLPTNGSTTCTLDADKLKAIKFDGKDEAGASIDNAGTDTITLTITKVDSSDSIFSTGGYKFAFASNKDITISSTSPAKYIKKNTNTEFKIKETTSSGSAKTLSLEKAWTVTTLAQKVGLTCTGESSCTPGDTIKGYKNGSTTKTDATVGEAGKSKTISVTKDQENYNQGFKFTVSEDICLSTNSEKIATGDYEIKEDGGKWYLTKKEEGQAGS